jgi:hypothetical protein
MRGGEGDATQTLDNLLGRMKYRSAVTCIADLPMLGVGVRSSNQQPRDWSDPGRVDRRRSGVQLSGDRLCERRQRTVGDGLPGDRGRDALVDDKIAEDPDAVAVDAAVDGGLRYRSR